MTARPAWLLLLGIAGQTPLLAQAPAAGGPTPTIVVDSASPAQPHVHRIRWYEAAAAVAGTSVLMLVDDPVERYVQRHRSNTSDDVASAFRHAGQPEVYATVSLGLVVVGLASHNSDVARAGGRAVAAVGLAGASTLVFKTLIGRARPDSGLGSTNFHPFSRSESMPSGHSALAFALMTSLADDVHSHWLRAGFYSVAVGTAFSRVNDNRHWLSDTGFGAIVGITSAKLADGHWRIFGIKPPAFLLSPSGGAAIGWQASF